MVIILSWKEDFLCSGFLDFIGNVITEVVHSNNKRDVDIITDNNRTRVEISKLVLGGVTLIGTLALQFYCNKQNKPTPLK